MPLPTILAQARKSSSSSLSSSSSSCLSADLFFFFIKFELLEAVKNNLFGEKCDSQTLIVAEIGTAGNLFCLKGKVKFYHFMVVGGGKGIEIELKLVLAIFPVISPFFPISYFFSFS